MKTRDRFERQISICSHLLEQLESPFFFMDENADNLFALSGAEKKKLRGQAQLLEAKISVGKNGVSPEMLKALDVIFKKEALVKVRFSEGRAEMKARISEIESGTQSVCVGHVGRTASFFKKNPPEL